MRIFVKTGWVAAALMATAPSAQADTHMVPGSGFDMADNMSGGMAMDMSAMLRPNAAPPSGITGGMYPAAGKVMPTLGFMHMEMDGNRDVCAGHIPLI